MNDNYISAPCVRAHYVYMYSCNGIQSVVGRETRKLVRVAVSFQMMSPFELPSQPTVWNLGSPIVSTRIKMNSDICGCLSSTRHRLPSRVEAEALNLFSVFCGRTSWGTPSVRHIFPKTQIMTATSTRRIILDLESNHWRGTWSEGCLACDTGSEQLNIVKLSMLVCFS